MLKFLAPQMWMLLEVRRMMKVSKNGVRKSCVNDWQFSLIHYVTIEKTIYLDYVIALNNIRE